jgi:folate-binding Fe-S cluster repair protein YgfZ
LGQELTVRTYHTGATRKRILPIHLDTPAHPGALYSGADISYHPPSNAASQKVRSAGKILAMHGTSSVGLGLVRLEMLAKSCWSVTGERGKLSVNMGGQTIGLFVGDGEAYAAVRALQHDA